MAPGFPIRVGETLILTSEALYQACRFPHRPDVQQLIIDQRSPMTAKMRSKPYRKDSRRDWDDVGVDVMRWCLRVKLAQNWTSFGGLLLTTGDRPIVEESMKDAYWGARPRGGDTLVGQNILGRMLMELREELQSNPEPLESIAPPSLQDFLLLGTPIEAIHAKDTMIDHRPSLFDAAARADRA